MIVVLMMQMTVVGIIRMPVVLDSWMPAPGCMFVGVVFMRVVTHMRPSSNTVLSLTVPSGTAYSLLRVAAQAAHRPKIKESGYP
jgi:hypothetical protein